jgi:hypothetical protein
MSPQPLSGGPQGYKTKFGPAENSTQAGDSKGVFLRAERGNALTPPIKIRFRGIRGRESFRGAHGFESGKLPSGPGINRCGGTRRRRQQVCRQNTLRLRCKLGRAGATGGGRDGRPRESRIFRATIGSSMVARMCIRERHRGHSRTSRDSGCRLAVRITEAQTGTLCVGQDCPTLDVCITGRGPQWPQAGRAGAFFVAFVTVKAEGGGSACPGSRFAALEFSRQPRFCKVPISNHRNW